MTCERGLKEDFKHSFKHLRQEVCGQLRKKGFKHWIIAAVLIIGGTIAGHELGKGNFLIDWRYKFYQWSLNRTEPRTPHPKRTVLVLIGDEEYWNGPLERRIPLKRDYLANLLRKIDEAHPAVIALDVRLSSPVPEKTSDENPAYQEETEKLLNAVRDISLNRAVVLAKEVRYANPKGYNHEPTVFDGFPFGKGDVREGYISLPYDLRRVPLAQTMQDETRLNSSASAKDKTRLDSFASAIVRAVDERTLVKAQAKENDALPYGTFIKPEEFPQRSSKYVLDADLETRKKELGHKIIIVGGAWHKDGFGRGIKNDGHQTPVGEVFGVFVHANYVEALLDSRSYRPMRGGVATGIEIFFAVILALFFGLDIRLFLKIVVGLLLCAAILVISYVSWQNLGMFFDFFIPVILLIGHIIVERIFR